MTPRVAIQLRCVGESEHEWWFEVRFNICDKDLDEARQQDTLLQTSGEPKRNADLTK